MGETENKSNWWIWKVFWILLIVTTVEVVLGIIKPEFLIVNKKTLQILKIL